MKSDNVVVVGGAGFIGSHIVRALQNDGSTPTVVSNDPAPHLNCEVRIVDVENLEALTHAIDGSSAVVHLAARAGGIQMQHSIGVFRQNRLLTDNVLEACRRNGIRNVFLASSQVIYRNATQPLAESDPIVSVCDAPSKYAWSKATDEVVARWWMEENGSRVVVGRFGNIYGPGASYAEDRSTVVHALIQRFVHASRSTDVVVWGDGSAIRSVLYVSDAARAVVSILRDGAAGSVYNVDSGIPVSIRSLALSIEGQVGNELNVVFDPSKPSGVPYRVGSIDEIRTIGFEPQVELEEGLARTIEDYRTRFSGS